MKAAIGQKLIFVKENEKIGNETKSD